VNLTYYTCSECGGLAIDQSGAIVCENCGFLAEQGYRERTVQERVAHIAELTKVTREMVAEVSYQESSPS